MRLCIFFSLLLSLAACNNQQGPAVEQVSSELKTDSSALPSKDNLAHPAPGVDSVPNNIQIDTLIHVNFPRDSNEITIRGSLNKNGDPVTCYLPVTGKKALDARLVPDDSGLNIRFSQIIFPDGESDGPFNKQLKYKLAQQGTYKIIIGPNMMANGKKSGDFNLKIKM